MSKTVSTSTKSRSKLVRGKSNAYFKVVTLSKIISSSLPLFANAPQKVRFRAILSSASIDTLKFLPDNTCMICMIWLTILTKVI